MTPSPQTSYYSLMHCAHAWLAASPDPREIRSVYVWGGILMGVVLISFFVYSYFKRWMNDTGSSQAEGFTLSDLRKLRDQGKMSSEEYEQTRSKIVAATRKMTGELPDLRNRRDGKSDDRAERPSDDR